METGNTGVVAYSGEHMPRHIDFWYDVNATDTCIFYDILYVFLGIETTVQRISPNTPQFGLRNLEVWIVLAFGHLHTTAGMCVKRTPGSPFGKQRILLDLDTPARDKRPTK